MNLQHGLSDQTSAVRRGRGRCPPWCLAPARAPGSAPRLRDINGISSLESLAGAGSGVPPGVQLEAGPLAQLLGGVSPGAAAPRQEVDREVEAAVDRQQQVRHLEQPRQQLGEGVKTLEKAFVKVHHICCLRICPT